MDTPLKCPCYFQLPTHYNPKRAGEPGEKVEEAKLSLIFRALDRQFGGWTHHGTMWGSWAGQEEASIRVCVSVPESEIDKLRMVVREIGRELGQKQMYFERGSPSVELINVEE